MSVTRLRPYATLRAGPRSRAQAPVAGESGVAETNMANNEMAQHHAAQDDAARPRDSAAVRTLRRLLSPASGLLGQGMRYVIAGSIVTLVYLLTTTLLAVVFGVPFRYALPIGFALQLSVHYTLQRTFVWIHEERFALPFSRQMRRYLTVAGSQFALTALSTSLLPRALGLSTEVVYLATACVLTSANFLLLRNVIFHPERAA
jgi:putative flippase GtrA